MNAYLHSLSSIYADFCTHAVYNGKLFNISAAFQKVKMELFELTLQ